MNSLVTCSDCIETSRCGAPDQITRRGGSDKNGNTGGDHVESCLGSASLGSWRRRGKWLRPFHEVSPAAPARQQETQQSTRTTATATATTAVSTTTANQCKQQTTRLDQFTSACRSHRFAAHPCESIRSPGEPPLLRILASSGASLASTMIRSVALIGKAQLGGSSEAICS